MRNWKVEIRSRVADLNLEPARELEIIEELSCHLEDRFEELVSRGHSEDEATRMVLEEVGRGNFLTREFSRTERPAKADAVVLGAGGGHWLGSLIQDIRYGARMLRKNPGFTAVATLTLALGIGANTAIFSVVNAVMLKPLPYPEPDQLAQLGEQRDGRPSSEIGGSTFVAIRDQSQLLARVAAYTAGDMTLTGVGSAERIVTGAVTMDFFPLLGVQPALGRNFVREEDTPNGPTAVILGDALWKSRFGGDPNVLGRGITLNEKSYTVVGVLPASFQFPEPFQIWTPLAFGEAGGTFGTFGEGKWLMKVIARLKPGVTLTQAQTELRAISQRTQSGGGDEDVLTLASLHEQVVGEVKGALLVLLGAVALVLLIACANVANLLTMRAAARQREMAVRAALGANRRRIARQLLTESVLLSLAGGGLGIVMAFWGVRALAQWSGRNLPAMHAMDIDGWVLAFTLGVSLITGLTFGLAPAIQAWRSDLNGALKEEGRSEIGGHRKALRHFLVVSEVAVALALLIGAGLLIKSFSRLMDVNPGFRTDGVLTFQVSLKEGKSAAQRSNFTQRIVERLKALPGVEAAAATDSLPLTPFTRIGLVEIEGRPPIDIDKLRRGELKVTPASRATVTADYFNAMGIPLKSGRGFTALDARPTAGVAIVNESFARHHFPGESPIGKRIHGPGPGAGAHWLTVVGVVGDVRQSGLAKEVMLEVYHPVLDNLGEEISFALRASGDPIHLMSAVRAVMAELEPNQPIHNMMTMEQRLANTTTGRRLNMTLLGGFAGVAALLAAVGIYGVMSYSVTQRRREIGVRMALGARSGDVLGLFIRGGLRLTLLGVAIGLAMAFALTRYLSSLLYSVNATDPLTFATIAAALTVVALFACWLPARAAARTDPMVALRVE